MGASKKQQDLLKLKLKSLGSRGVLGIGISFGSDRKRPKSSNTKHHVKYQASHHKQKAEREILNLRRHSLQFRIRSVNVFSIFCQSFIKISSRHSLGVLECLFAMMPVHRMLIAKVQSIG